jgi:disulfide bond formation protein DsbB
MMNRIRPYLYPVAFLQALVAMAGSLYFSEVMLFVPCVLCWYQRITMYPLVAILFAGIYFKDSKVYRYVLPLAIIGLLIATYHVVLYYGVNWGIRPDWVGPCVAGVSCTTKYVEWYGFITIPLLSWVAHLVITVLMGLAWKAEKRVG